MAENQADYAAAVKAYHYNYVSAEYWGHSGGRSGSDYGHDQPEPAAVGKTDTIATFVYRSAIVNGQFESASAITLYQSIFGFFLVLGSNLLVKKFDPDYALF